MRFLAGPSPWQSGRQPLRRRPPRGRAGRQARSQGARSACGGGPPCRSACLRRRVRGRHQRRCGPRREAVWRPSDEIRGPRDRRLWQCGGVWTLRQGWVLPPNAGMHRVGTISVPAKLRLTEPSSARAVATWSARSGGSPAPGGPSRPRRGTWLRQGRSSARRRRRRYRRTEGNAGGCTTDGCAAWRSRAASRPTGTAGCLKRMPRQQKAGPREHAARRALLGRPDVRRRPRSTRASR